MTSVGGRYSPESFLPRREGAACRECEIPLTRQGEALPLGWPVPSSTASLGRGRLPDSGAQSMESQQCRDSNYILQGVIIMNKMLLWSPSPCSYVLSPHCPELGWEKGMLFMGPTKTPRGIGCDHRDDQGSNHSEPRSLC